MRPRPSHKAFFPVLVVSRGARPRRDGDRRAGRAAGPGAGRGRDSARCGPGAGARGNEGGRGPGGSTAGGAASGSAPEVAGRAGRGLRHRVTVPADLVPAGSEALALVEGWPSFVH